MTRSDTGGIIRVIGLPVRRTHFPGHYRENSYPCQMPVPFRHALFHVSIRLACSTLSHLKLASDLSDEFLLLGPFGQLSGQDSGGQGLGSPLASDRQFSLGPGPVAAGPVVTDAIDCRGADAPTMEQPAIRSHNPNRESCDSIANAERLCDSARPEIDAPALNAASSSALSGSLQRAFERGGWCRSERCLVLRAAAKASRSANHATVGIVKTLPCGAVSVACSPPC